MIQKFIRACNEKKQEADCNLFSHTRVQLQQVSS
jgi:hypothetical protein